jgi:large subunit ribosomal protein L17
MALIGDKDVVQVLFDEIGPYYSERPGGYTRVLRLVKPRLGDASVRAYLGYVREDDEYPEGDCRAKHAVEGGAAAEAVVSEEADGSVEVASDDGEVQGAAAADSAAADESDSSEVEAAAGEQSGAQEAASEAQEDSESAEESAEESDEASKQAEAEVEDSSTSEQEEETPPEKDQ